MINRTLIRTRVIQTLFAYYQNPGKTPLTARKELMKSFADTYDLYFILLDFINELTAYAQRQMEEQRARARATHSDWAPNRRLVDNRFAQQQATGDEETVLLLLDDDVDAANDV